MTAAEVQASFAPTADQARLVTDYLTKSGFTDIEVSSNRMLVSANGSAAAVRVGFNTQLANVKIGDISGVVNMSAAQVPKSLGGIVASVLGLQTIKQPHTFAMAGSKQAAVQARVKGYIITCNPAACWCNGRCGGGGGGAPSGYNPALLAGFYGASTLQLASATSVGIIADGTISTTLSDLATYASQNGFAAFTPATVYVGTQGSDTTNITEWDLDSQTILGVSGGKLGQMTFYVASALTDPDLTATYNAAVNANATKLINVSIGECEATAQGNGAIAADDAIFEMGVAQGQTFSVASGDSGSNTCGGSSASVSYPASSPYVIAVGGTTLTVSNNQYSSESAWSLGGGGSSAVEPQPSWQAGIVTGSARGIPDVAFDADPSTGIEIVLKGAASGPWGGTSIAAPNFVGLMARFQTASGNVMPFPAQWIYHFPVNKRAVAFHDVTTGSNGSYSAGIGWDYTTGWGSMNAANVVPGWAAPRITSAVAYILNNQLLKRP